MSGFGFNCNDRLAMSPIGRVFGYVETLVRGDYTDSGVILRGTGGSVFANVAESPYNAISYPKECISIAQTSQGCGCGC